VVHNAHSHLAPQALEVANSVVDEVLVHADKRKSRKAMAMLWALARAPLKMGFYKNVAVVSFNINSRIDPRRHFFIWLSCGAEFTAGRQRVYAGRRQRY
jgi:hypothetical protein